MQGNSTAEEWSSSAIISGRGKVLGLRLVFLAVAAGLSGHRVQAQRFHTIGRPVLSPAQSPLLPSNIESTWLLLCQAAGVTLCCRGLNQEYEFFMSGLDKCINVNAGSALTCLFRIIPSLLEIPRSLLAVATATLGKHSILVVDTVWDFPRRGTKAGRITCLSTRAFPSQ